MSIAREVSFGPFRLSVDSRTLLNGDGPVALSSRAFDVLLALIESHGSIVSKDQLMRRVWSNVIVEENNLHVQIAAARRALGTHQGYIVTIPGRGYRFAGPLPQRIDPPGHAPEAVGEAVLTNLPSELTAMVGRVQELGAIGSLLERTRLVTLVGPGGVGKTRLALAAAHAMLPRFADGVWLVELGPVAAGVAVAEAVAASLKIEELQGKPLAESIAASLRQRCMLLVLDGCEHVGPAVADLAALLLQNCPGLSLLCTSQALLGLQGEQVRRIAPLDVPDDSVTTAEGATRFDAVILFVERARAADERFVLTELTAPSVMSICRSLDGIPLALELAAARVALLGLEPVRLRIVSQLALLSDNNAGPVNRHQTLQAAFDWSFGLLPERDREILGQLSVFAGGFTLAAALQVTAGAHISESDILQSVSNLVRRSLLTTGPDFVRPRHGMLATMRGFAQGTLAPAERASLHRRHALCFHKLAADADAVWELSDPAGWLAPLSPELDNFRAALAWSLSAEGDAALGAHLAAATSRIWYEGGHLTEGRNWLARALERAPADLPEAARLRLHRGLADLSIDAGAAVINARKALDLAIAAEDPAAEGICSRMLAAALIRAGRYGQAEAAAKRALTLLSHAGHPRTYAKCLSDLAIIYACAGDLAEERRYNALAQAALRAIGDDRGVAICLQYAAETEFASGGTALAIDLAEKAASLFRGLNSRYHLGVGLGNLAAYRLAAGEVASARDAAAEALAIALEIEDQPGVVICLSHIALAAALLGAPETAAKLHGHVEAAYRSLGLERQETEQIMYDRLCGALRAALPEARQASLEAEGRLLRVEAACKLAFAVG